MKLHYCFLERFNNYFNRKIIKYETLLEYQNNSKSFFIPQKDDGSAIQYDFNPNDNVMTEIIDNNVPFDPDYFLLFDEDGNIVQRWFILEQKRNRQGQWLYQLRRDVIADNVSSLLTAPVFVQKGWLSEGNPLVINPEGMNFNQIKTSETFLKDFSNSAWLVAYLSKSLGGTSITKQIPTQKLPTAISLSDIATDLGIPTSDLEDLLNFNNDTVVPSRFVKRVSIWFNNRTGVYEEISIKSNYNFQNITSSRYSNNQATRLLYVGNGYIAEQNFKDSLRTNKALLLAQMASIMGVNSYLTTETLNKLKRYEENESIIYYLSKYYKLKVAVSGDDYIAHDTAFAYDKYSSLKTIAEGAVESPIVELWTDPKYNAIGTTADKVYIQLNEISDSDVVPDATLTISSTRKQTLDQEYDIICMPANDIEFEWKDNNDVIHTFTNNADLCKKLMMKLAIDEDANIYDVQLLPYCPLQSIKELYNKVENEDYDFITTDKTYVTFDSAGITPDSNTIVGLNRVVVYSGLKVESGETVTVDSVSYYAGGQWNSLPTTVCSIDDTTGIATITVLIAINPPFRVNYHYDTPEKRGVVFYIDSASFIQNLDYQLSLKESMKMDSQTDLYRIIAPNYQGVFDFNVAKNGGSVDYFTAYCTYKPYTPFIKVAPNFNYIYGTDYNDNRGLICAGDFSVSRVSSAWESYQLQNKNYQNIFNRDIQSLDLQQSLEMRQQLITGGIGIFTDAVKGGIAGGMVGGGYGAIAGAVVGGVASTAGYVADIDIMSQKHHEARSYAVDKFNYQLGNIKALPYSITKVGSFDVSSKIFPVLEYYTCTDEEKEALRMKLKYESMTVMKIGYFGDFYKAFDEPHYFKGELIRCDELADDNHMLEAIYAELLKGVYI